MSIQITAQMVKELRERTGAPMMDCKGALAETGGDADKAVEVLRKKGLAKAAKKAGRVAADGLVASYIHAGGKLGVLIEVNCETDFVARNDEFQTLVRELAMHIAAMGPLAVTAEEIPADVIERERAVATEKVKAEGKPEKLWDKIVDGMLKKFYKDNTLMDQAWVRDPDKTIAQLVQEAAAKTGENIVVRRFVRYALGE